MSVNGEYELTLAGKLSNMNTGILRLHNVYGPPCEISEKNHEDTFIGRN